jgi:rod shape-determining protein MreC
VARWSRGGRRGQGGLIAVAAATALVSIAGTLFLVDRASGGRGPISGLAADVAAGVGGVVSAPVRWVQDTGAWASTLFRSADEIRALEAELAELRQWREAARAMAERLDRYEALLNMPAEPFQQGVAGRLVGESGGPFSRSGLVNVGERQGVRADFLVASENGLVGRVVSVGESSARVLLLTDANSRVPVMGEQSRARAILIGDKTAAPRLMHLADPPVIAEGERLVTSGDDGVFPRGLTVGVAGRTPAGDWRARLAADRAPLDFVRLIPPQNIPAPPAPVTRSDAPGLAAPPPGQIGAGVAQTAGPGASAARPPAAREPARPDARPRPSEAQAAASRAPASTGPSPAPAASDDIPAAPAGGDPGGSSPTDSEPRPTP